MTNRRVIALVTLLALLVAPLCAPFCRAHVCVARSSSAQDENCHVSAIANEKAPELNLVAAHTCGLQELPAAALETSNSCAPVKQRYATHASLNFVPAPSVPRTVSGPQSEHPDRESCTGSRSVRPSVLRI
jgi:hypothetical protein